MSENKKSNDSGIYYLAALLGLFFAWKLLMKLQPIAIEFYREHWIYIMVFSTASAGYAVHRAWDKVAAKRAAKVYTDRITKRNSGDDSVFVGLDEKGKEVFVPLSARKMHAQVVGTTNAGKTESIIVPWVVDDISKRRGLILLDGKSDETLLDKIYAYTVRHNRQDKFKYFSLVNIEKSHTFNPLLGGTTEEVAERIFNAFTFENEYYRGVQYEIFSQILRIFENAKEVPTFFKLHEAISNPLQLRTLVDRCENKALLSWGNSYITSKPDERQKKTSGFLSQISLFAFGTSACLFNVENPTIDIDHVLKNNETVYFQLPVLRFPTLGQATGKLILQVLQSAVSNRHQNGSHNHTFFSCYLDDFSEFMPKTFISLLNKSRSANVGITFAHQALGDLKALGPDIENTILVNSNLKVFMRTNEPDSAEYFAKVGGTSETEKATERQTKSLGLKQKTGESSIRLAEEFVHHPNEFKKKLGVGEAIMMIPHARGMKTLKVKLSMLPDLKAQKLPSVLKEEVQSLPTSTEIISDEETLVEQINKKEVSI